MNIQSDPIIELHSLFLKIYIYIISRRNKIILKYMYIFNFMFWFKIFFEIFRHIQIYFRMSRLNFK